MKKKGRTEAMYNHRRYIPTLGIALALFLSASASYAQQTFGSIFGTVTDPTGAAVSNAKITVKDINKGTSFEVTSDESGNFNKGQLIPDTYTVTIATPGFQKVVSNGID